VVIPVQADFLAVQGMAQILETIGAVRAQVTASRGFNAIVWREGELGYALVSDVETPELRQLVGRLAPTS